MFEIGDMLEFGNGNLGDMLEIDNFMNPFLKFQKPYETFICELQKSKMYLN